MILKHKYTNSYFNESCNHETVEVRFAQNMRHLRKVPPENKK